MRFVFNIQEKKGWISDIIGLAVCLEVMFAFTLVLIRKVEQHNRETGELQFY